MKFSKGKNRFYKENEDGKLVAEIKYKYLDNDIVDAYSTFVDPSLRGQGVAEKLVDRLVEEMKTEENKIYPTCSYIVELFKRKKEKYTNIMVKQ